MLLNVYGLLGHAGKYQMPMESLDAEELEPGEEFIFNGRVYEIRSVNAFHNSMSINVSLVVHHATG